MLAFSRSGRSLRDDGDVVALVGEVVGDGEDAVVVVVRRPAPAGRPSVSWWLSSTRSVPPSSLTGNGSVSEPCVDREAARAWRSAWRAAQPSSGWLRFASSSISTTIGQHDVVLVEADQRARVGQQDRGVEHIGTSGGADGSGHMSSSRNGTRRRISRTAANATGARCHRLHPTAPALPARGWWTRTLCRLRAFTSGSRRRGPAVSELPLQPRRRCHELDDVHAFLLSLGVIFVAELGDKSQLMAFAFSTRFSAWRVLAGITAAAVTHAVSVGIGDLVGKGISGRWINLVSGLAFLGFAAWTLRGDTLDEEEEAAAERADPARSPRSAPSVSRSSWPSSGTRRCSPRSPSPPGKAQSGRGPVRRSAWWRRTRSAIVVGHQLGTRLPERTVRSGRPRCSRRSACCCSWRRRAAECASS